jgi:polynucleotide 5'-hydroxyl-kinase GRC3/NOL9
VNSPGHFDLPAAWKTVDFSEIRGTILVVGAPDVGKSTFVKYLYQELQAAGRPAAYLDGDPGQSSLGPPAVVSAEFRGSDKPSTWRRFIGSTTPVGHMLDVVVGAARLAERARRAGAEVVLCDTCGLVDPPAGGLALKLALVDLLQPALVVALRRGKELDPLLQVLRKLRRTRLVELDASPAARRRSPKVRQAHRREQFAAYFSGARVRQVSWENMAVLPGPYFSPRRLVALEDAQGFTLRLGIILDINQAASQVTLLTPSGAPDPAALHLGSLELDLKTFQDKIRPLDPY